MLNIAQLRGLLLSPDGLAIGPATSASVCDATWDLTTPRTNEVLLAKISHSYASASLAATHNM